MNDIIDKTNAAFKIARKKHLRKVAKDTMLAKSPGDFAARAAQNPEVYIKAANDVIQDPKLVTSFLPKKTKKGVESVIKKIDAKVSPEDRKKIMADMVKEAESLKDSLSEVSKEKYDKLMKLMRGETDTLLPKEKTSEKMTTKPPEGTIANPPEATEGTKEEPEKDDIDISPELREKLKKEGIPPGILNVFSKTLGKLEKKE